MAKLARHVVLYPRFCNFFLSLVPESFKVSTTSPEDPSPHFRDLSMFLPGGYLGLAYQG